MSYDYTQSRRDAYDAKLAQMVAQVHRIADDIEREGRRRETDTNNAGWAASQVLHTLMWGLANLSLDRLVSLAAEVDAAPQIEAEVARRREGAS